MDLLARSRLPYVLCALLLQWTPGPATAQQADSLLGEFVLVEAGTFSMGSDDRERGRESDEGKHQVTIGTSFYIGRYEVTQAEYETIMGSNPSQFIGADRPVENVSWYDAIAYCNARSRLEGRTPCYSLDAGRVLCDFSADGYRLPTEAEWEYAARGGPGDQQFKYAGGNRLRRVGWFVDNADIGTHPVGTRRPNRLGLSDMSGNVSEWCWDWYEIQLEPGDVNPTGPPLGFLRVERGGGWYAEERFCRVANRNASPPRTTSAGLGFRIVRTAAPDRRITGGFPATVQRRTPNFELTGYFEVDKQ